MMIYVSFWENPSMLLLLWLAIFAISLGIEWATKQQYSIVISLSSLFALILTCLGENFLVQMLFFSLCSAIGIGILLFLKKGKKEK